MTTELADLDAPRLRVRERPWLPSSRAVLGGLLLALAGMGAFVSWQHSSGAADTSYVVARRAIRPGERLGAEDVRLAGIELPSGTAAAAFATVESVVGRVALGPVGEAELLQAAQLSDAAAVGVAHSEVSFALARDRAVDGQLRSGDRVDVFVTLDEATRAVAEGVQVVAVASASGPGLTQQADLTITLALADPALRVELIHAVRVGEVTLVRSTLAALEAP